MSEARPSRSRSGLWRLFAVLAVLSLFTSACGDDDGDDTAATDTSGETPDGSSVDTSDCEASDDVVGEPHGSRSPGADDDGATGAPGSSPAP